ncbi:hypothetical protein PR048_017823 [Dryococelus australis]|uniref:Uncharacterized protein n=1 Tax=Dryococelus australis TaxID=614101 RepID=A0ABQ9HAK3_9NEOP|nr:hypothetical protein PR048_017823 [Dryococelus australis]
MNVEQCVRKAKGVKPNVLQSLYYQDYLECLKQNSSVMGTQYHFHSHGHNVYTEQVSKVALSSNDETGQGVNIAGYVRPDKVSTLPSQPHYLPATPSATHQLHDCLPPKLAPQQPRDLTTICCCEGLPSSMDIPDCDVTEIDTNTRPLKTYTQVMEQAVTQQHYGERKKNGLKPTLGRSTLQASAKGKTPSGKTHLGEFHTPGDHEWKTPPEGKTHPGEAPQPLNHPTASTASSSRPVNTFAASADAPNTLPSSLHLLSHLNLPPDSTRHHLCSSQHPQNSSACIYQTVNTSTCSLHTFNNKIYKYSQHHSLQHPPCRTLTPQCPPEQPFESPAHSQSVRGEGQGKTHSRRGRGITHPGLYPGHTEISLGANWRIPQHSSAHCHYLQERRYFPTMRSTPDGMHHTSHSVSLVTGSTAEALVSSQTCVPVP